MKTSNSNDNCKNGKKIIPLVSYIAVSYGDANVLSYLKLLSNIFGKLNERQGGPMAEQLLLTVQPFAEIRQMNEKFSFS